jgi:predicted DNA-binding transcriptional regulator AlpA
MKVEIAYVTQAELAERWRISPRTLERWRVIGQGPRFVKLGRRVVYRLSEVEAHEAAQQRACTRRAA